MPDAENNLIVGGGLAGVGAAYWAKLQNPRQNVILLEKSDHLLGVISQGAKQPVLLGNSSPVIPDHIVRGAQQAEQWLSAWPGLSTYEWLGSLGIDLKLEENGAFYAPDIEQLRQGLSAALSSLGVQVMMDFALETVSPQPDGGFRIWSKEGVALDVSGLLLATGGQRNHGMKLALELKAEINPVFPAFTRLRLPEPALGARLGPLLRRARVLCPKSGREATGLVRFSSRGLEGPCLSALSAQLGLDWQQKDYKLKLEVDWLPGMTPTQLRKDLTNRTLQGGRRLVGQTPLYDFNARQWNTLLRAARIDVDTPWVRLKQKRVQSLAHLIKGHGIQFRGMGLPKDERAWGGGVALTGIETGSCQSVVIPRLFFSGEILDFLGLPGGWNHNLAWASAHLAGSAMGRSND